MAARSAGSAENSLLAAEELVLSDEDSAPSVAPEVPSNLDSSAGLMVQIAKYNSVYEGCLVLSC